MNVLDRLEALFKVLAEEVDRNPHFAERLAAALDCVEARGESERSKSGRRARAVLDPVAIYREGETILRERLLSLDLEQLRDIVAGYGMDPGKLVMKWKTRERVVDHIVETAAARARKGEAFR